MARQGQVKHKYVLEVILMSSTPLMEFTPNFLLGKYVCFHNALGPGGWRQGIAPFLRGDSPSFSHSLHPSDQDAVLRLVEERQEEESGDHHLCVQDTGDLECDDAGSAAVSMLE